MKVKLPYSGYGSASKKVIKELLSANIDMTFGHKVKNFTWKGFPVIVYVFLVKQRIVVFRQPGKVDPEFEQAITNHCKQYGLSVRVIHSGGSLHEAFDTGELQYIIETDKQPLKLRSIGIRAVKYINV